MNRGEWKNIYGDVPEAFSRKLERTLDRLEEEKEMKRRYKLSTVLLAAAMVALLAGAAVAAGMGLIENVNRYSGIQLLPGAGELVESGLGSLSTELFDVEVEEAVYDRYTVYAQLRITPRDAGQYALYSAEYPEPDEENEVYVYEDPRWRSYDTLTGRTDGKKVIFYDIWAIQAAASLTGWPNMDYLDVQNNADGSVSVWLEGRSKEGLTDDMEIRLLCRWGVLGEYQAPNHGEGHVQLPDEQEFVITVRNAAEERIVRMEPVGESEMGEMTFYSGSIVQTPISGYYTMRYLCRPSGWIGFTDAQGREIEHEWSSSEPGKDQEGRCYEVKGRIQAFEPLPERIFVAVYDGQNRQEVIDRIEVELVSEE